MYLYAKPWIVSLSLVGAVFFLLAVTASPSSEEQIATSASVETHRLIEVQQAIARPPETGEELYGRHCATCHAKDGTGEPELNPGIDTPRPDFTDCSFVTREPDSDFMAVAHEGGPVRGFAAVMPPFGEVLTEEQIQEVLGYIRTFCTDDRWPRGELNLPRPLVTEKAYPEDEAVLTTSVDVENEGAVMNELVYEKRFGARNQLEIVVPFGVRERASGDWSGARLGDIALGAKRALYHSLERGTIFSMASEVILPTGDSELGFGSGTTIVEPFASFGQFLPADAFVQVQGGAELPIDRDATTDEIFLRGALGRSFTQGRWGRAWTPMVEAIGWRDLAAGAQTHWDLAPQMQVTLNKRQHVMLNVGVRIPMDDPGRDTQFVVYLLWDWFDGGLFEGW